MKANILFKPIQAFKCGTPVMAEVEPDYYLDSYIVGYCGDKVYVRDEPKPFPREKVRPYAR